MRELSRQLRRYFSVYGGVRAVVTSPFFILAVIVTVLSHRVWMQTQDGLRVWVDLPISSLPSILGFTIGAFSILIAVGLYNDLTAIFRRDEEKSYFVRLASNFVHFSVVQVIALIFSIIARSFSSEGFLAHAFSAIGFLAFIYAILLIASMSLFIYSVARIINRDRVNKIEHAASSKSRPDPFRKLVSRGPRRGKRRS
jgi:uncharacterized membrane protein